MHQELSFKRRLLYCFLSAVLVCLSFPSFLDKTLTPWTAFFGWFALVPFFRALQGAGPRRGAWLGWFFGFVQFGGILYWIAFLEAAEYLSGLAWLALVLYLSLYFLLFGWAYGFLEKKGISPVPWAAPFLWVALEFIRGTRPWGGFSWGELGYSQAPYPALLTGTSWAGVYGLTFLMVWFNASLAMFLQGPKPVAPGHPPSPHRWQQWVGIGLPWIFLLGIVGWGNRELQTIPLKKTGKAVLLQPSVAQEVKWSKENEKATYDKIGRLVKEAGAFHPGLIVWPETAAPSYLRWAPRALERVTRMVRDSGTFHLVGCLDAQQGKDHAAHCFNSAVQFAPDGKIDGIYHKRHLVPFGEFVPFQKYLTFLGPVVGDLGNFDPGEGYRKFQTGEFTYTPLICYEVIFPGDVQQALQTGAEALVNISNDAWYGRTASPYQHAMMAVVRAAEERKPLLRAANTGICLATDPFGRILGSTRLFEEGILPADVLEADLPPTLYSRWGNWFPRLCGLVSILLLLWAAAGPFPAKPLPPSPGNFDEERTWDPQNNRNS